MDIEVRDSANVVPYAVDGTKITFGMDDNKITIDCAAKQTDMQVMIDVFQSDDRSLTLDKEIFYVATVIIPPAKYNIVDAGEKDDMGNEKYNKVKIDLMDNLVQVVLWPLAKSVDLVKTTTTSETTTTSAASTASTETKTSTSTSK